MAVRIAITLNERLYLRDPQATDLGQSIIEYSIILIHEIGFEAFTFRKLAARISSTEASVYRYFANKQQLLLYLVSWYWEWVSYLIDVNTRNIADPCHRLKIIINTFVQASQNKSANDYIDKGLLHKIVITEGAKAYHTKTVDQKNAEGLFLNYKRLTEKVATVITEVAPQFPYTHTLASNLFEMVNDNIYFARHLPRLTDVTIENNDLSEVRQMINFFAFKMLGCGEKIYC